MELLKKELMRIEKEYMNETYTHKTNKFFKKSFWREIKNENVSFFVSISQNLYELTGIEEYREVTGEKEVVMYIDNIIDDVIDCIMNSEDFVDFREEDNLFEVLESVGLY